jgi:hypothetical protein
MTSKPLPTRRQAIVTCAYVVLTALMCAGLLSAAALVPAPLTVLPLIVLVCIGCPMFAAWELRPSIAVLRAHRGLRRAHRGLRRADRSRLVVEMRRFLDGLPETPHPFER